MGDEGKKRLDEFNVQVIERLAEPPWNSTYAKDNGIPVRKFKYIAIKLMPALVKPIMGNMCPFFILLNQDAVDTYKICQLLHIYKNTLHKFASALLMKALKLWKSLCNCNVVFSIAVLKSVLTYIFNE